MKEENAPSLTNAEIVFVSFFGTGFLPKAPGTWGALAICPVLYGLSQAGAPYFFFIPFLIMATVISCFIAQYVQQKYKVHNPPWIVIDEVLGMWTAWIFTQMGGANLLSLLFVFGVFRFFDIMKTWPIGYLTSVFDKKLPHGVSVILDDIISGTISGLLYLGVHRLFPHLL